MELNVEVTSVVTHPVPNQGDWTDARLSTEGPATGRIIIDVKDLPALEAGQRYKLTITPA